MPRTHKCCISTRLPSPSVRSILDDSLGRLYVNMYIAVASCPQSEQVRASPGYRGDVYVGSNLHSPICSPRLSQLLHEQAQN